MNLSRALSLSATLLLCGCQTVPGAGFCAIAPELYYRQQVYDAMNDREAAKTLSYQLTGERLCDWRAP